MPELTLTKAADVCRPSGSCRRRWLPVPPCSPSVAELALRLQGDGSTRRTACRIVRQRAGADESSDATREEPSKLGAGSEHPAPASAREAFRETAPLPSIHCSRRAGDVAGLGCDRLTGRRGLERQRGGWTDETEELRGAAGSGAPRRRAPAQSPRDRTRKSTFSRTHFQRRVWSAGSDPGVSC